MDRRRFLWTSCAGFLAALTGLPRQGRASSALTDGVDALPEITAAVDILVPPDPEIPGDFKGSDYGAQQVVAAQLGDLGQAAVAGFLNTHAQAVAGKDFLDCDDDQRMAAIKDWVKEREQLDPTIRDMLTGLLTIAIIGTYEENTPEERDRVFESMGWYDPEDPAGTFRIPNEGYVDSYQFPVRLKKGLQE